MSGRARPREREPRTEARQEEPTVDYAFFKRVFDRCAENTILFRSVPGSPGASIRFRKKGAEFRREILAILLAGPLPVRELHTELLRVCRSVPDEAKHRLKLIKRVEEKIPSIHEAFADEKKRVLAVRRKKSRAGKKMKKEPAETVPAITGLSGTAKVFIPPPDRQVNEYEKELNEREAVAKAYMASRALKAS